MKIKDIIYANQGKAMLLIIETMTTGSKKEGRYTHYSCREDPDNRDYILIGQGFHLKNRHRIRISDIEIINQKKILDMIDLETKYRNEIYKILINDFMIFES